tara:strand:+ start:89 stop:424 length:336 start_codon:yes stop_codon:yes gene_type:complete
MTNTQQGVSNMSIKYIAITKEYRDTDNGNSYFSTRIEDVPQDKMYILPFQYGYGTQSEYNSKRVLKSMDPTVTRDQIEFIKINNCNKTEVEIHGQGDSNNFNKELRYYYQD